MVLKEFPAFLSEMDGEYNEKLVTIPAKLYKTLEMLSQDEIPNSEYSIGDLEGLMKSLILRQSRPGQFDELGGNWSLIGCSVDGTPVDIAFFPTYMVVSLMTLFWYRYPGKAKRLKGFQEALHEGLNFASLYRPFSRFRRDLYVLKILKMGDVFRYVVEHVDEYPRCRNLYNVLIDFKSDIDRRFYSISREIRSLHRSLSILPDGPK